ncbi:MAG: SpoIIIAH-like family protein [Clostridia bacterium]|nr:SpoIIIAH-like family protein [Clostridia bacterium]
MTKKKKIIIMSSLVLLLAVTAVLNVLLVSRRTEAQADAMQTANYFTSFRAERTSKRSQEILQIDSILDKYEAGSEKYESATDMKLKIVGIMENELVIETMIKSLGFSDAVVSIGMESDNVNVFINTNELDTSAALSIYNLLRNELGVPATNIIIMPVYTQI